MTDYFRILKIKKYFLFLFLFLIYISSFVSVNCQEEWRIASIKIEDENDIGIFNETSVTLEPEIIERSQPIPVEEDPILTISQGRIRGKYEFSRDGNKFMKFLGIPYGRVKFHKRFSTAESASKWDGIRDGSKFGAVCMHFDFFGSEIIGSDTNCLNVNVFTRNLNPFVKKPVMVFIHGGSFSFGSGDDYKPNYLIDEDIILVTINYRLGPFGFLNLGIPEAEGNQGIKDMILALKWVQNNIEYFGGDKNKVTIFGVSAGSAAVSALVISPLSNGLFHSAIMQGGTAITNWAYIQDPIEEGKMLGHLMDCPTENLYFLAQCLEKLDGRHILKKISSHDPALNMGWRNYRQPRFSLSESLLIDKSNAVFPEDPLKMLKEGKFNKIPIIMGINKIEGAVISAITIIENENLLEEYNRRFNSIMPITFGYENEDDLCLINSKIREFYFPKVGKIGITQYDNLVNLFSDAFFIHSTKTTANLHSKHAPVFIYHFTFQGESMLSLFSQNQRNDKLKDPTHADEIQYQFGMKSWFPNLNETESFNNFSKKFNKLWASFAKNGKPSETWGQIWQQYNGDENNPNWFQIGEKVEMVREERLFGKRMQFWNDLNIRLAMKSHPTA